MEEHMKRLFYSSLSLSLLLLVTGSAPVAAQVQDAPANVAAALIVKLAAFEKNIASGGDVTVYVMEAPEVAIELEKGIGQKIGSATLKTVLSGSELPGEKPAILYVGDKSKVEEAIGYTHTNKVLSMTGIPDLVNTGITLGFGVGSDGKPQIKLNLSSTVAEGLSWNPAIMKVAKTVK